MKWKPYIENLKYIYIFLTESGMTLLKMTCFTKEEEISQLSFGSLGNIIEKRRKLVK